MTPAAATLVKVQDPELAEWLAQDSGETREILVETTLPGRRVRFEPKTGRMVPSGLDPGPPGPGREEALDKLKSVLSRFLDSPPVILRAAGALAVRASSRQVRQFVTHPLVKSVRPNRRLRRQP